MKFELSSKINHIFILGAGASADYGLPTWDKLGALVSEKIIGKEERTFEYKKDILCWMNKIGKGKEYGTIDQCITKESRSKLYRSNGLTIENHIFSIINDIFEELYKEYENGWINKLNQKIIDNPGLEGCIAFINYNYDKVLRKNILNFEYLVQKERDVDYRKRLVTLYGKSIETFFPHGNFFSEAEPFGASHLSSHVNTRKSGLDGVIDAVSCHESEAHTVKKYGNIPAKVYLLGLGNGLQVNLSNINFENSISELHVTIKDPSLKHDEVLDFLSDKFNVPKLEINIYLSCEDLINKFCVSCNG